MTSPLSWTLSVMLCLSLASAMQRTTYVMDLFKAHHYHSHHFIVSEKALRLTYTHDMSSLENYVHYDFEETSKLHFPENVWTANGFLGNALEFRTKGLSLALPSNDVKRLLNAMHLEGSFYWEIYAFFYDFHGGQVALVEKKTFLVDHVSREAKHQRIALWVVDRTFQFRADHVFYFQSNTRSVHLKKGPILKTDRWYRLGIAYHALTGELTTFIDNAIIETQFITADGTPESVPYYCVFPKDMASIKLAHNMLGKLDKVTLIAHSNAISILPLATNVQARYTTKVFRIPLYPHSRLEAITVEPIPPKAYVLSVDYRRHTHAFSPDERSDQSSPKWIPLSKEGLLQATPASIENEADMIQLRLRLTRRSLLPSDSLHAPPPYTIQRLRFHYMPHEPLTFPSSSGESP